jgi:hypothetical protein
LRGFLVLLALALGSACLPAAEFMTSDENSDGKVDRWYSMEGQSILEYTADRNFDGIVDHRVVFDEDGLPAYEELDFNLDGAMDDFYFYSGGALSRREIDSNYDDRCDIWVYLVEGVYVQRIERDADYDGEIDRVTEYGKR